MTAIATEIPANTTSQDEFKNLSRLQKRARAKYLTRAVAWQWVGIETPLKKQVWNTWHCSNNIILENGKETTRFCRNRFCMVCSRKRSAKLIKQYQPTLDSWQDKHFLTLTIVSIGESDLKATIAKMKSDFYLAKRALNDRRKRKGLDGVKCILSMESTHNNLENTYHPHFHIVTDTYETAHDLRIEWIERNPTCAAFLQDIRKADEKSSKEIFKYVTKVITTKDEKRGVDIRALDTIHTAFKGVHTFKAYGFKVPAPSVDDVELSASELEILNGLDDDIPSSNNWDDELGDWINSNTRKGLSGYVPSKSIRRLSDNIASNSVVEIGGEIYTVQDEVIARVANGNSTGHDNSRSHPARTTFLKNQARNVDGMELKRESVPRNLLETG